MKSLTPSVRALHNPKNQISHTSPPSTSYMKRATKILHHLSTDQHETSHENPPPSIYRSTGAPRHSIQAPQNTLISTTPSHHFALFISEARHPELNCRPGRHIRHRLFTAREHAIRLGKSGVGCGIPDLRAYVLTPDTPDSLVSSSAQSENQPPPPPPPSLVSSCPRRGLQGLPTLTGPVLTICLHRAAPLGNICTLVKQY